MPGRASANGPGAPESKARPDVEAVDDVEHVFDYGRVTAAPVADRPGQLERPGQLDRIAELQQRVQRMQGAGVTRTFDSLPGLEQVLRLYREMYFDFNVRHFREKLQEVHGIRYSYTWVKRALQEAGLVEKRKKPGSHRKRRPRRPLPRALA